MGRDALAAVTELLQRNRLAHATAGLYEAAEVQWWWAQRVDRPTDRVEQLFWVDEQGIPVAASLLTQFGDDVQFDPIVLPDAPPAQVAHVVHRGLAHAAVSGYDRVVLEVAPGSALHDTLVARGFVVEGDGLVESWLVAAARPAVSPLHDGYRLSTRADEATHRPHHMIHARRDHTDPEPRLREASLYRPDLDLVVYDADDAVAAYGLFWYDPRTRVGVVEPMRTEDEHQRRGLARHVLTSGIERLVAAGADRIKICFEPGNPASSHLYLDVGFVPHRTNLFCTGPTSTA